MAEDAADQLLMRLAQQSGGLEKMLEQFFGFLHRRTDFYNVIPEQGE